MDGSTNTSVRSAFERTGLHLSETPLPAELVHFLQAESARLRDHIRVPRPWHYAELHNPWGRAAACYDSWGLLDVCQSPVLVETVASLLGPDVILFDSQWLPSPCYAGAVAPGFECDAHRFAVDPQRGLTVLVCFGDTRENSTYFDHRPAGGPHTSGPLGHASLLLEPGSVLMVDSQLPYRVRTSAASVVPTLYAVRYFPATSRYNRDPSAPVHRELTERYPLINHALLPLWLMRGEDKAGNDFVTGFNVRSGYWSNATW